MPLIGFLRSSPLPQATHLVAAFRRGLAESGYHEGREVAVEYRSADNRHERLPAIIAELLRRPVDLIVANHISALPAKAATSAIPIVFATGSDPLRDGLVAHLNRPGGNVTGVVFFATDLGAKRLQRLREALPENSTIAMLVNPGSPNTDGERSDVLAAAQGIGQKLLIFDVRSVRDVEPAFAAMAQRGVGGLLAGTGAFLHSNRERIVALAARYKLPAIYAEREFAEAGGLMSYGASITEAYRQAGIYAARILNGESPGELPVIQSSKIEFVINRRAARALGLDLPPALSLQADTIIE